MNKTQIIASLAKISNKNKDELNIVSSVVQYPDVINLGNLKRTVDIFSKNNNNYKNFIVIELSLSGSEQPKVELNNMNMKYIKINIFDFINMLLSKDSSTSYQMVNLLVNDENYKFNFQLDVKELFLSDNMKHHKVILILQGLSWSIILYLFRIVKISMYGGSITRRHILSTAQLNLVYFLHLLNGMYIDTNIIYQSYNSNSILNSKYEKELSKIVQNNIEFDPEFVQGLESKGNKKELLFLFFGRNYLLKAFMDLSKYKNMIENLLIENKNIESEIQIKKDKIKDLSYNVDKDLSGRSKRKLENGKVFVNDLTSKLNKNIEAIAKNKNLFLNLRSQLINNNFDFLTKYIENNLKDLEWLQDPDKIENKGNNLNINKAITSKREYSTLVEYKSNKDIKKYPNPVNVGKLLNKEFSIINCFRKKYINNRNYSTSIKKVNFYIDSPGYFELQRIINSYPIDNQTQIKIETFLKNQGSLLFNERLNQILDINYEKINSDVINIIRNSLVDLDLLVENLKKKISLQLKQNKNKQFLNETFELLNNIDNKTLISYLLGRLLRIISNNNLLNNNTFCSNVSIDLSKDLVNFYILNEYKKNKDKNSLSQFIKKNRFVAFENEIFLFQFGMSLCDILLELNLMDMEVIQTDRETKHTIFIPKKNYF